ncbi:MAG: RnfH family protein [Granulosicoccus sp.]
MRGSGVDPVSIEVVYALPEEQQRVQVEFPAGTRAREALYRVLEQDLIELSATDSALERSALPIGVYGQAVADDYLLVHADRLEIYRPLLQDPKERRRQVARQSKKNSSG